MKEKEHKAVSYQSISTRQLSKGRLLLTLLVGACVIYGVTVYSKNYLREMQQKKEDLKSIKSDFEPWFASYVDVTSTPAYAFEQLGSQSAPDVVLSFIVSSRADACVPSWGNYYTMEEAAVSLDLDRRIARLQQQNGKVAISLGGQLNTELAVGCTDEEKLLQAYRSLVERYGINTLDLDIEGGALSDRASNVRRAKVIARLQKEFHAQKKNLAIWMTVPVAPHGLTPEGTDVIADMLAAGVDVAGVNVMTMDYGESRHGRPVLEASKAALTETHRQLGILYQQAGVRLGSKALWQKIGATPMIGQNDIADEVFTVEDAKGLNAFAQEKGMGRMSMWSANRDIPCGENYVNKKIVSDSCSGVEAAKFAFQEALRVGFDGNLEQNARLLTHDEPQENTVIDDDPQKSPYQIWSEKGAYPKGVKVVWHGNVYEAKWWTKNDLPDNPVLQSWETPWQLIGPVMPGEKPIEQPVLPAGTYPAWDGETIYDGGKRILFEGIPFQAKWWNKGECPAASAANPDSSPWMPLSQAEIQKILAQ